jgi:hypothetical protein
MFEQPVGKAEKDRSRTIIIASGLAVLVVIILIVLISWIGTSTQQKIELYYEGSPEFQAYAQFVKVEVLDRLEGERFNSGQYKRIICLVQNTGDKTLTGLQLQGAAIRNTSESLEDYEIVKEKITTPIPSVREALAPNQSFQLDIYIEPLDKNAIVDRLIVQVKGLQYK